MTDKELLELAAKAAGWTGWQSKHGCWNTLSPEGIARVCCEGWPEYDRDTGEKLRVPTFADAIAEVNWNPLVDDGDALRLAVKLRLDVCISVCRVGGEDGWYNDLVEEIGLEAATRLAIVRAAAEIGKATP
jgi:hypothetical protein